MAISRINSIAAVGLLGWCALGWCGPLQAAPTIHNIRLVTDITAQVEQRYYDDDQSVSCGAGASGLLLDLSAFSWSDRIGVDALMVVSNLLVFSTDADFIHGTNQFADEDLVAYHPASGTLAMYFDGSKTGLPSAINLDAAALPAPGQTGFLFSVDITASLPGVGYVADEDILRYASGVFSKFYDGVTHLGVPDDADLDALYVGADGRIFFSLDKPARIGSQWGTERDVWAFTPPSGPTVLTVTGAVMLAAGVDLVALDEPVDSDGDLLTDFEEASGVNEASSTLPESNYPLDPAGHVTQPLVVDTDGDGVSDGYESAAGSNPTNADDYLRMTGLSRNGTGNVLTWASSTNRFYTAFVIESGVLTTGNWLWVAYDIPSQGAFTSVTNTLLANPIFYRVQLSFP